MKVLVVFGGKSCEHDISIITAYQVAEVITGHEVVMAYVDRENVWRASNLSQPSDYLVKESRRLPEIRFVGKTMRWRLARSFTPDVAILCSHGINGEDGSIAGLLRLKGIPTVNGSISAQGVAMDKALTKILLKGLGLPHLPYIVTKTVTSYELPSIVKPLRLGSSIGIAVAHTDGQLAAAIETALMYDTEVLVEPSLTEFTEVNCAAYGYKGEVCVSSCEKPLHTADILDFAAKYMRGGKGERRVFPYRFDRENEIRNATEAIYRAINPEGVIRVDFLVENDAWYVNEINAVPGSLAMGLFEDGLTKWAFLDRLMENALFEHRNREKLQFRYKSEVLSGVTVVK